jgi:hypothetical protein
MANGKDLEGGGRGLLEDNISAFASETEENHGKSQ